jgi:hypothetical protein
MLEKNDQNKPSDIFGKNGFSIMLLLSVINLSPVV